MSAVLVVVIDWTLMGASPPIVTRPSWIWRDFLPYLRMSPLLDRALFAAQRDDHDYGVQDANPTDLVPWGIAP